MEENKQTERRVITISRKKLIISVVVLAVIVLIGGWAVLSVSRNSFGVSSMESALPMVTGGSSSNKMMNSNSSDYYRYQEQDSSIKDTREFLKTNYSSTIKTRDVSDVVKQVKNIVKGADGRIDEFNTSEKYGRVRFVVAKSKFDDFRDEVESITHKKLYTESISSQNLLTEKQGIEGQISDTTQSLDSLISQKTELTNSHNKTVISLNKELSRINTELVKVRASIVAEKDSQILVSLRNQEASLVSQYGYQKQKLTEENNSYSSKNQNFDFMINNVNNNLTNINKQDDKFMDNIETVNGFVSAQWVSYWELAVIFLPIHPTWIIIILIIASFVIFRKRMPKVVIQK